MSVEIRPAAARHTIAFASAFACAAVAAAGCGTRALQANTSTGTGGTTVINIKDGGAEFDAPFRPTRNLDVLFMIDNSAGMRLHQDNLLRNFPVFVTLLENLPGGLPNLHIAVITSDLGAGDGTINGCSGDGDGGRFQYAARGSCLATNLAPGATFIATDGVVSNFTGQLSDVFACIAPAGAAGCGYEQPLAAVARALGADGRPAPVGNQGFLRPDAFLFIVLLTDEDDCSVRDGVALFDTLSNTTLASPLGPVTNFRCNEFGHVCSGIAPPRHAPTNSVDDTVALDGCVSAEDAGLLTPIATLRQQIRSLKPFPDQQILVAAIAGPSTPYVVGWTTPSLPDTGPWPLIRHACVATDGSGNVADPGVRLNQFTAAFGANGQRLSICLDDFTPVFSALAAQLAGLIPR